MSDRRTRWNLLPPPRHRDGTRLAIGGTTLLACLLAMACGESAAPPPPPGAVEQTIKQLEANEQEEKDAAITVARAREQERMKAAAERLEGAER